MATTQSDTTSNTTPSHTTQAPSTEQRRASLWHNRDFLLLWSGQAVSNTGTQLTDLALPLLILALTHSAAQAGIAAACSMLPRFLLTLPAGVLVDRLDRKHVMIASDIARALALASLPLALALHRLSMPQIYLVSLIQGAGFTFFWVARVSALPHVVSKEQLPAAVAQNEAAQSIVTLLGPPLGGVIFGIGQALPFLGDAISYVASAVSLRYIRTPFQAQREQRQETTDEAAEGAKAKIRRLWDEMLEGLRWLWHAPLVRFMSFVYMGHALLLTGEDLCYIVLAQRRGVAPLGIGLIFAAGGVGGLLGALVAPRIQRRYRFGQILPILQWGYPLSCALFALAPSALLMGLIIALGMVVDQIYDVVWDSYRIALIPDALRGRVSSADRMIYSSMLPVGALLSALLLQRLGGVATLFILAGGLSLLAVVVGLNPHVRHAKPVE